MIELLQRWKGVQKKSAWMRTAALRAALRKTARDDRGDSLAAQLARLEGEKFEPPADELATFLDLLKSIDTILPPRQKRIFFLSVIGYTGTEIAEITGSSHATVRSQLRHARLSISKQLKLH
ncbi:sigma-70 family RNA polymerase sigma factor [Streptomyces sp. NPDC005907]|uniref:RNA polymerase sigma factor n=1 Tax=Streptomyces sp. NPDC005907 TaxID=3154571 RepID=UPI0033C3A253